VPPKAKSEATLWCHGLGLLLGSDGGGICVLTGEIGDGLFAIDYSGKAGLADAPAVYHGHSYNQSFADGHVNSITIQDNRTKKWDGNRSPANVLGPANQDWAHLKSVSTILLPKPRPQ